MEIIPIFAKNLFAFQYPNETMNERTHLKEELRKLDFCKRWLRSEGILDREGLCDND